MRQAGRWGVCGYRASNALVAFLAVLGATASWNGARAEAPLAFTDVHTSVGTMQVGETKSVTLTLTNHSANAIEIESVTSSCYCTTVMLAQSNLAPGESTSLTAEVLHEMYVVPDIRSQITVKAKGYPDVETAVILEGHLTAPFHVEPESVIFDAGTQADQVQSLVLISRDDGVFTVSRFEAPEWVSIVHTDTDGSTTFSVQLAETVPYELLQGEITFWTEDPRQPVVRVPVTVTGTPIQVEVSPRVMMLGEIKPGAAGSSIILRTIASAAKPTITKTIPGIDIRVDAGPKPGEFTLTPLVSPEAVSGPLRGVVHVTMEFGSRKDHTEIGVVGTVLAAATD